MKSRQPIILGLLVLIAGICALILWFGRGQNDGQVRLAADISMPTPALVSQTTVDLLPATNSSSTDDRPEVQALYRFANAAKIFNFNPEIIACQTNQKMRLMELATPTHDVEIVRGFTWFLASREDGSDTRANPAAVKDWYQCTGTWNEKAAVEETLAILKRLGREEIAGRLAEGSYEYEADSVRVLTPDGESVEVTPFAKIKLKSDSIVLHAQYRMGTNGPAGLTRWFYLGP